MPLPLTSGVDEQALLKGKLATRPVLVSCEQNRKEFGLNWNAALEAGGFLLGDDIKIELEVQAVRKEA